MHIIGGIFFKCYWPCCERKVFFIGETGATLTCKMFSEHMSARLSSAAGRKGLDTTWFCWSKIILPECVAKGSRFIFGGLGVDQCSRDPASGVRNHLQPSAVVRNRPQTVRNRPQPSATVRNRPQPSATVRNRPQPFATVRLRPSWAQSCRANWKSRKNVTFLTCQKLWSCRFAWQAWHFVTFQHVSRRVKKLFCVAGAILATFSEDVLHFSWQAKHFGHLRCHFAWQELHFRRVVSCRVACFLRIALSALREVVTRCKFRGRHGILWRVMKMDGSLARNVDFAVGP